ncbi:MAG TPA: hypothetical protein VMI13_10785 [Solirubrobacteraceae bacterium]|nr:hypothetical protein [Solirubrobacteraceae bacterium]
MRTHGDNASVLRPDLREQGEQDSAPLGGILLELPEAPEVLKQLAGPPDLGVVRWAETLELLLNRLAAHHVLGLEEVAHEVEVAEALELGEQLGSPLFGRLASLA